MPELCDPAAGEAGCVSASTGVREEGALEYEVHAYQCETRSVGGRVLTYTVRLLLCP